MGTDTNALLTLFCSFAKMCPATNSSLGMLISLGATLDFATSRFWSTGVESWYVTTYIEAQTATLLASAKPWISKWVWCDSKTHRGTQMVGDFHKLPCHASHFFRMPLGTSWSQCSFRRHTSLKISLTIIVTGALHPCTSYMLLMTEIILRFVNGSATFKHVLKLMCSVSRCLSHGVPRILVSPFLLFPTTLLAYVSSSQAWFPEFKCSTLLCHLCNVNPPSESISVDSSLNVTASCSVPPPP